MIDIIARCSLAQFGGGGGSVGFGIIRVPEYNVHVCQGFGISQEFRKLYSISLKMCIFYKTYMCHCLSNNWYCNSKKLKKPLYYTPR